MFVGIEVLLDKEKCKVAHPYADACLGFAVCIHQITVLHFSHFTTAMPDLCLTTDNAAGSNDKSLT